MKLIFAGRVMMTSLSLTLAAIPVEGFAQRGDPMTPEINRLTNLFKTTKVVCLGRFLFDVPVDSDVIYGPARLPYLIERLPGAGRRLDEVLADRKAELVADDASRARGNLLKPGSMFGKVVNGVVTDQWIVFGASKSSGSFYSIESFQRIGGDLYVQQTASPGDEYRGVLEQINAVASNIRSRATDELPSGSGICLDGAFIKEPAFPMYEAVALGIRLRQYPDVSFSLEMIKKERKVSSDSLEARIADAEKITKDSGAGDWYNQVRVFRRGFRNVGKWEGYEYLARKPMIGRVMDSHEFAFFSHGEPGNAMLPTIDIALDTGVKGNMASATKTSITDEEALYLWDKLLGSIRPILPFDANLK
ncbi:T6SS immunity protein Tli4 family protein [Pseudoduganella sp. HUAS MS19]